MRSSPPHPSMIRLPDLIKEGWTLVGLAGRAQPPYSCAVGPFVGVRSLVLSRSNLGPILGPTWSYRRPTEAAPIAVTEKKVSGLILGFLQYLDLRANFADEYRKAWALCYPTVDESILGHFSIEELVASAKKPSANGTNSNSVNDPGTSTLQVKMDLDGQAPSAIRMIPQSNY